MSTRFSFHGMMGESIHLERGNLVKLLRTDYVPRIMMYLDYSTHGEGILTHTKLHFLTPNGMEEIRKNMIFACEVIS